MMNIIIWTQCRETISAICGRTGKSDSDVEGEPDMAIRVFWFVFYKLDTFSRSFLGFFADDEFLLTNG